jgi:pimeloyl-ACP methyl ester carboxylesterase
MADLRTVGRVTGDEFSMYTVGGHRFIIRGFGNEIRVAPDVAKAVAAGRYGRWSEFDLPTLIMHGDDDQVVPIGASAMRSSKLVNGAKLKVYPGLPHGMATTHAEQINEDLLAFLRS